MHFKALLRQALALAATVGIAVAIPSNSHASVTNHYARWHFGQSYGYREKQLTPDSWRIKGLATLAEPGFVEAMTFHRAAILAKAAGFDRLRTVSVTHVCSNVFPQITIGKTGVGVCDDRRIVNQELTMEFYGIASGSEAACQAPVCKTYQADEILSYSSSFLGLTSEQDQQELFDAQRVQTRK